MKGKGTNLYLLAAAALAVAAGAAGVSCTRGGVFRTDGAIRFSANLPAGVTRTSYSGEGTPGTGGLSRERIDWVNGDLIRVYSPEASRPGGTIHWEDYRVTGHETPSDDNLTSRATVAAVNSNLQWGEGDHTFYAVYPSPSTTGMPDGMSYEDGVLTGVVTAVQTGTPAARSLTTPGNPTVTWTDWLPDMRQAYMLAYAEAEPLSESVKLPFRPKFSSFEIVIGAGLNERMKLTGFTLTSTTGYLTGTYTLGTDGYGDTTPEPAEADIADGGKSITVSFGTDGLTLTPQHPASITVIALPTTVSGLTISFTGDFGKIALELKKTDDSTIEFGPYGKHRIYGLAFPSFLDIMAIIPDRIIWDGEYTSDAYAALDDITWDADYTGDANHPGDNVDWNTDTDGNANTGDDNITWGTDAAVSGPFGGLYLTRGYLTLTADGYALSGDDQLEILRYYNTEDVTTTPRHYLQFSELPAAAVEGCALPTRTQWETLIGTTREGAEVSGNLNKHYAKVTVDLTGSAYESYSPAGDATIKGLLLFPDGVEVPCPDLTVFDTPDDAFTDTITYATLQNLCNGYHGCVFLPCAGKQDGSAWAGGGSEGLYWSGTSSDGLDFVSGSLTVGAITIAEHYPARLVRSF